MSWVADIWKWAGEQGPLVNILAIMSSMGGAGGAVYTFMRNRYRRQEVISEGLEKVVALQKEELVDLKEQIKALRQYDPHAWLEQAERECKNGNEEKAIADLRSGVMRTSNALHETFLSLARSLSCRNLPRSERITTSTGS